MPAARTLNVYLPGSVYAEIARVSAASGRTKGEVARERLARTAPAPTGASIEDLFGVADDLPRNLSAARDKAFRDYGSDGHR